MKKNYFPNKNLVRGWHCFTYLQISLMPDLLENIWILIAASAFDLF